MPMKVTDKVFSLRLPIATYEALEAESKKYRRSVNTEILIAIDKHLAESQKTKKDNNLAS